jgi:DNA-binding phage protein
MAEKKTRGIIAYKSYMFRDKDPIIDQLRTVVADSGESWKHIHESSGVSLTCMHGWFKGETRRPQFATVMAVTRALGYDLLLARAGDKKSAQVIHLPRSRRAAG